MTLRDHLKSRIGPAVRAGEQVSLAMSWLSWWLWIWGSAAVGFMAGCLCRAASDRGNKQ